MSERVLVVDDKKDMVAFLKRLLQNELGLSVEGFTDPKKALERVKKGSVDMVITDVKMPGLDGISLLEEAKRHQEDVIVIILTGYGTVELAVNALKRGAYDFLTKPVDNERFIHTVRRAIEYGRVLREKRNLEQQVRHSSLRRELIGESPVMNELLEKMKMIAETDETVLITGETGTGKELAARTIHRFSRRDKGPFIAVNCPAIPENILESELFGYKRGAFTSATSDKKGLFEAADGGTIFLDEIGDIPLSVQSKLLRVLQEKEFKPLGDTDSVKVDVRVIASTNQDIEKKIHEGSFRDDLYYRLNVISLRMPSLSERQEDIPLLAEYFLIEYAVEYGKNIKGFTDQALDYLKSRRWPGNVRELQNVIKRAVVFEKGAYIGKSVLQESSPGDELHGGINSGLLGLDYKTAREKVITEFTREYVRNILKKTEGNVTHAARLAGIERQSLQHLIRRYGIDVSEFR
ncbi:MAG: sigma-54-dependent Fis family transcriptional regulator [Nitrospirae bacterium]|nr:MAG: sigma-54-dependent Fis family transcriptional regulator [Nitrospirota bacterium]